MTAVVTDTCASIPPELAEGLQIEIVPYYIHRANETLRDLVDISHQEFYEWLPTARELPTTANPGPGDYLQAFERVSERASEIVAVTMTSKGSGAYQSACVAREMAASRLPGLVELMAEWGATEGPIKMGITHAAAPERAKEMLQAVTQSYDCCQVLTSQLSPVLGVHTGVGTVGVNFFPVPPEPAW